MSLRSCEILLFLLFWEKLVTRRESTSLRSPAGNLLRAEFLSQPASNTSQEDHPPQRTFRQPLSYQSVIATL